jgi:hypothetical protein
MEGQTWLRWVFFLPPRQLESDKPNKIGSGKYYFLWSDTVKNNNPLHISEMVPPLPSPCGNRRDPLPIFMCDPGRAPWR